MKQTYSFAHRVLAVSCVLALALALLPTGLLTVATAAEEYPEAGPEETFQAEEAGETAPAAEEGTESPAGSPEDGPGLPDGAAAEPDGGTESLPAEEPVGEAGATQAEEPEETGIPAYLDTSVSESLEYEDAVDVTMPDGQDTLIVGADNVLEAAVSGNAETRPAAGAEGKWAWDCEDEDITILPYTEEDENGNIVFESDGSKMVVQAAESLEDREVTIRVSYTQTVTGTSTDGSTGETVVTETTTVWRGEFKYTPSYDSPAGVSFQEADSVGVGSSLQLVVSLVPEFGGILDPDAVYTVEWSSDNVNIATVEDGEVTGIAEGEATIIAIVTDSQGTKASGSVTIAVMLNSITFYITDETGEEAPDEITMTYGDGPLKLGAYVDSGTNSSEVTWSSDDEGVAAVENGVVTIVGAGDAVVTAYIGSDGKYAGGSDSVTIHVDPKAVKITYNWSSAITKPSDGTASVVLPTEDLSVLFGLEGLEDGDDVSVEVTDCGGWSYSGVLPGDDLTVTGMEAGDFALTGRDSGNYTLNPSSVADLALWGVITAVEPDENTADLTTAGNVQLSLELENGVTVAFFLPRSTDENGDLWYGPDEEWLQSGWSAYTDEECADRFSLKEENGQREIYLLDESSQKVYGPVALKYNYDGTAPELSTEVTAPSEGTIDFSNTVLTYTVTVSDVLSGVDANSIRYAVVDSENEVPESGSGQWKTPDSVIDNGDGTYTFTVNVPGSGYLCVLVSDHVGNTESKNLVRPLVIEGYEPSVTVEPDGDAGEPAQSHSFDVSVSDDADLVSGIGKVEFVLTLLDDDGGETGTAYRLVWTPEAANDLNELLAEAAFSIDTAMFAQGGAEDLEGATAQLGKWDTKGICGEDVLGDGYYSLTVTAVDNCGNTSSETVGTIKIDNTAPTVNFRMTGETMYGELGGTYYFNADNVGFSVSFEDYFIEEGVEYTITATDSAGNKVVKTSNRNGKVTVSGTEIKFTYEDLQTLTDGTITVTVSANDHAQNTTDAFTTEEDLEGVVSGDGTEISFFLDTTAPELTAAELSDGNYYPGDGDSGRVYWNGEFSVTYTIDETYFYTDGVESNVKLTDSAPADDSGAPITDNKAQAQVTVDGESKTVKLTIPNVADAAYYAYSPVVTVTDKAGNKLVLSDSYDGSVPGATDREDGSETPAVTVDESGQITLDAALVLDTVAPKLTAVNSTDIDEAEYYYSDTNMVYYNSRFEIRYTVQEIDFDPNLNTWQDGHTGDGDGAVMTAPRTVSSGSYTAVFSAVVSGSAAQAVYQPSLTVTDKAGNRLVSDYTADGTRNKTKVTEGTATASVQFVLDTVSPEYTLTLTDLDDTTYAVYNSRAYYNKDITATFTVTDENLESGLVGAALAVNTSADSYSTGTVAWADVTLSHDPDNESAGTTETRTLTARDDGVYRAEVSARDRAGNPLVPSAAESSKAGDYKATTAHGSGTGEYWTAYHLVRDTAAPGLNVAVQISGQENPDDTAGFVFSHTELTYDVTVTDTRGDIESVKWCVSSQSGLTADEITGWNEEEVSLGSGSAVNEETGTVTFEVVTKGYLYVLVTDRAGNSEFYAVERPMLVEDTAPGITYSCSDSDYAGLINGVTDQKSAVNHYYDITVTDSAVPVKTGSGYTNAYSGIREVTFTLEDDNTDDRYVITWTPAKTSSLTESDLVQTVSFTGFDIEEFAAGNFDTISVSVNASPAGGTWSSDGLSGNTPLADGTYTLTIAAWDNCGNTSSETVRTIEIDNTAPTVNFRMTGETVYGELDGTYYFNAGDVGFSVSFEDYFIGEGVEYTITATDSAGNTVVKTSDEDGVVTGRSQRVTFTYEDLQTLTDGTITVTVSANDHARNTTDAFTTKEDLEGVVSGDGTEISFILDTTAPELTAAELSAGYYYPGDGDSGRVYWNGEFSVTYTIDETYFYTDGVESNVVLTDSAPADDSGAAVTDNKAQARMTVDGVSGTVKLTIPNVADAAYYAYSPVVTVTDKAGNKLVWSDSYDGSVPGATDRENGSETPAVTVDESGRITLDADLVLDTVAPKLTAVNSTDIDEAEYYYSDTNMVYYNSGFEIRYTVQEIDFDPNLNTWQDGHTGDGDGAVMTAPRTVSSGSYTAVFSAVVSGSAAQAVYRPSLTVVDKAGNRMESAYTAGSTRDRTATQNGTATASVRFVLDTVNPEYTLTQTTLADTSDAVYDGRAYYNTNISAVYTVTDANLEKGLVGAAIAENTSSTSYDTATVSWTGISLAHDPENESALTSLAESLYIRDDGVYRVEIYARDRAGNPLVPSAAESSKAENYKTTTAYISGVGAYWSNYYLVRDTVAPVLNITIGNFYAAQLGNASGTSSNYYTVSLNEPYQSVTGAVVTMTKTDRSPSSVNYAVSSTTNDLSDSRTGFSHGNVSFTISGQQIFSLSRLVVTDRAGNTSTMPSSTNRFYLDTAAPGVDSVSPTVSLSAESTSSVRGSAGTDLYDSNVTVRAVVTDPASGVSSSGLYRVYYKVLVNGSDWTGQVGASSSYGSVISAGTISYGTSGPTYETGTPTAYNESITSSDVITFTFSSGTFNYNDVEVYVWAEDNAGNLLSEYNAAYYYFGIDVTAPTITVSYDNNSAENEKYFNEPRVATVTVTERNFNPSSTTISTEAGASVSGWSYVAGSSANGDDDRWVCTVTYSSDGDYTFAASTTDLVGHSTSTVDYGSSVSPTDFTVDLTGPVITVTFDVGDDEALNGKYFNEPRTATVSVNEHNFSEAGVSIVAVGTSKEGTDPAQPVEGIWSSDGDTWYATVPFTEDGDYTMEVSYVDLAGNEAETVVIEEFTVDTTPPTLEISGVEDRSAYNGDVIPVISYHDENYDSRSASMSIVGYRNPDEDITLTGSYAEDEFGGTLTCKNIEVIRDNDDVYTATATVSDLAGNITTEEIVFSVNRFGSNFLLSDETDDLCNDRYYINEAEDVHVIEINVTAMVENTVTTSINGEVNTLTEDRDYSVSETYDGWYQYDYVVNADAFDTEGTYSLTFTSVDEAGNTSSNRAVKEDSAETREVPVTFVLDMTKPVNLITGIENGGRYVETERTIVVNYSDNTAVAGIAFYMDDMDDPVEVYGAEDLAGNSGSLTYVAEAGNRNQTFRVVSVDVAGNVSDTEDVTFLLTTNLFVQYYNNRPLFIISLILIALIIALIIFLILRKKNKDEEEQGGESTGETDSAGDVKEGTSGEPGEKEESSKKE